MAERTFIRVLLLCLCHPWLWPSVSANNDAQISLENVTLTNVDDIMTITVIYTSLGDVTRSSSQALPVTASWNLLGLHYLYIQNFTHSHTMQGRTGQATVHIHHHTVALIGQLSVELHTDDLKYHLVFRGPDFFPTLPNTTQNLGGLTVRTEKDFFVPVYPGQDVVFRRGEDRVNFHVSVQSSVLDNFRLYSFGCYHQRVKYSSRSSNIEKTNVELCGDGFHTGDMVENDLEWSGSGEERYTFVRAFSRRSINGILKLSIGLGRRMDIEVPNRLLTYININQNLYLKRRRSSVIVRENTVYTDSDYPHLFSQYDIPIYEHRPYFTVDAIGNPKPVVTLHRVCSGVNPPEAEIQYIENKSRYEVIYRFRLREPREAVQCNYTIGVRSGTREIRHPVTIGIISESDFSGRR